MAKAADNVSTRILLRDAKSLVSETYQSSGLAEQLLIRWLAAGDVRWWCLSLEGQKRDSDPGIGDPEFWRETGSGRPGPGPRIILLRVNWSESSARRNGLMGYTAYRIELAKEDVAKLLPVVETETELNSRTESNSPTTVSGETKTPTKKWVADEARRMKAADEIPTGIKITPFAQQLAGRMAAAACNDPSIRLVKWRYIKNELRSWGLWPISKIKI